MRILRDLRLSTKVLILYELVRSPGIGQKGLAEVLEVTPQAVSDYLKLMEEEGLVERLGRSVRPTMTGVQFLQDSLKELGDFTYKAIREVNVIDSLAAVAGAPIKAGERVVIGLEGGILVARPGKKGSSMGVATRDTKEGEDLAVVELEGMLEYRPGTVMVVGLPTAMEGGTSKADMKAVGKAIKDFKPDEVAVCDPVGYVAVGHLDLEPTLRFGILQGIVDAAIRGQNVVAVGGNDSVTAVIEAVEEHNARSEARIGLSMMDFAP
jgi:putative transcriptional regulator